MDTSSVFTNSLIGLLGSGGVEQEPGERECLLELKKLLEMLTKECAGHDYDVLNWLCAAGLKLQCDRALSSGRCWGSEVQFVEGSIQELLDAVDMLFSVGEPGRSRVPVLPRISRKITGVLKKSWHSLTAALELIKFLLLLSLFSLRTLYGDSDVLTLSIDGLSEAEALSSLEKMKNQNSTFSSARLTAALSASKAQGLPECRYMVRFQVTGSAVRENDRHPSRSAELRNQLLTVLDLLLGSKGAEGCLCSLPHPGAAQESCVPLLELWVPLRMHAVSTAAADVSLSTCWDENSFSAGGGDDALRVYDRPLRVLLMEDSVLVQKILTRLLNQNDCDVTIAKNGRVGLELLQTMPFDVAVIDFVMPIMDGVETMRLFKEWMDRKRAEVKGTGTEVVNDEIILVGHSDAATDHDKSTALFNDMHIFCPKPMDPEVLGAILASKRKSSDFDTCLRHILALSKKSSREEKTLMSVLSSKFKLGGLGRVTPLSSGAPLTALRHKPSPKAMQRPSNSIPRSDSSNSIWDKVSFMRKPSMGSDKPTSIADNDSSQSHDSESVRRALMHAHSEREAVEMVRTLVIDDAVPVQKILHRVLTGFGCAVKVAVNGAVGVKMFKNDPFDIVFVDFQMPEKNGLTVISEFAELCRGSRSSLQNESVNSKSDLPLIVGMSDLAESSELDTAFSAGMHLFCPKPIDFSLLEQLVSACRKGSPNFAMESLRSLVLAGSISSENLYIRSPE